jgi:hypothetical protein
VVRGPPQGLSSIVARPPHIFSFSDLTHCQRWPHATILPTLLRHSSAPQGELRHAHLPPLHELRVRRFLAHTLPPYQPGAALPQDLAGRHGTSTLPTSQAPLHLHTQPCTADFLHPCHAPPLSPSACSGYSGCARRVLDGSEMGGLHDYSAEATSQEQVRRPAQASLQCSLLMKADSLVCHRSLVL